MLKAAWHWGSDSSIDQFLWGTTQHPPVCRPYVQVGLHEMTLCFSRFHGRAP